MGAKTVEELMEMIDQSLRDCATDIISMQTQWAADSGGQPFSEQLQAKMAELLFIELKDAEVTASLRLAVMLLKAQLQAEEATNG